MKCNLQLSRLHEVLHYKPETGEFVWRVSMNGRAMAGSVAGTKSIGGYMQIRVDGGQYKAHRLAWFYVNGSWPKWHVDHVNGIRSDNRIENLRQASPMVNAQNRRNASCNNKSGFLGVSRRREGWRASIQSQGIRYELGIFQTAEQAYSAYVEAKRRLHDGCTL